LLHVEQLFDEQQLQDEPELVPDSSFALLKYSGLL